MFQSPACGSGVPGQDDLLKPGRGGSRRAAIVSAITVTYYTGPILWTCITAVLAQAELAELIIVINGADAETRARLDDLARTDHRARLIDPGRNIGFAAGCNLGAATARADFLALINPDCDLAAGTFGAILDVFARQAGAWLVGGRLQHPDGREQRGGRREFLTPWRAFVEMTRLDRAFPRHPYFRRLRSANQAPIQEASLVPVVSGAFMMIRRSCYERLGGLDDDFFLYFDDLDLCLRVHHEGGEVWYAGNVPITHYRSTSDAPRVFIEWHKTRSGCRYFKKHFRRSYPGWCLSAMSAALWVRFVFVALEVLPYDLGISSRPRRMEPANGRARGAGTPATRALGRWTSQVLNSPRSS
jgi:N-acetylglucosaminyl-diphospho-decaprenol L-rhamnosyltransferase